MRAASGKIDVCRSVIPCGQNAPFLPKITHFFMLTFRASMLTLIGSPVLGRRSLHMRRRFVSRATVALVASLAVGFTAKHAKAGLSAFPQDVAGFTAATGSSAVQVDFESSAVGSSVSGQTIGGATFSMLGADPLVVDAGSTTTVPGYNKKFSAANRLLASSGNHVLSPGGTTLGPGPNPSNEDDSLRIDFVNPVSSFGFDLLSQRADGFGFVNAEVLDANGQQLFAGDIPISALTAGEDGIIPGGADFWGIVSDSNNIKTVILRETDSDDQNADNNVGYDSFRFATSSTAAIPLPAAVAGFPLLAAVAIWARKKMV